MHRDARSVRALTLLHTRGLWRRWLSGVERGGRIIAGRESLWSLLGGRSPRTAPLVCLGHVFGTVAVGAVCPAVPTVVRQRRCPAAVVQGWPFSSSQRLCSWRRLLVPHPPRERAPRSVTERLCLGGLLLSPITGHWPAFCQHSGGHRRAVCSPLSNLKSTFPSVSFESSSGSFRSGKGGH